MLPSLDLFVIHFFVINMFDKLVFGCFEVVLLSPLSNFLEIFDKIQRIRYTNLLSGIFELTPAS